MENDWPEYTVAELQRASWLCVEDGNHGEYRPRREEFVAEGTAFIRAADLDGGRVQFRTASKINADALARIRKGVGAPGDVLLSHKGTVGKLALVQAGAPPFVCSPQTTFWRTLNENKLDRRFLYAYMHSTHFRRQLNSRKGETDMADYVSLTAQRALRVPVPPIKEQRAIAGVLGALDDKIEQNRRTARALERMARAIFRAWFVDFEPVKAKAAGETAFPSMPQDVFDALPTRLVDSEIGPVPEGWRVSPIPELMEVNPRRRLRKGEVAPCLEMKNMPTTGHTPEAWCERPFGSGVRFVNGDTLVARITPCLENGKTAFVDFLEDGQIAWGSTEYIVLRPKPPLPDLFAYCLARMPEFREFAIQNMTGTSGRQRVAPSALEHFKLPEPAPAVAQAFGEAVGPMFSLSRANMDESRQLAAMRDLLLPKLLSGELRVGEVARISEEVV